MFLEFGRNSKHCNDKKIKEKNYQPTISSNREMKHKTSQINNSK